MIRRTFEDEDEGDGRQIRPGGGLLSRLWTQGLPTLRTLGTLAMYD